MFDVFDHPYVLAAAALVSLPVLFPIVRFFFDDFDSFRDEAGLYYEQDRALWLLGVARTDRNFGFKLVGIVAAYTLVALAAYQLACRVLL